MLSTEETLIRLLLAAGLGGAIGWERQRREKAAGLRTHILVCLGAALTMIVSAYGFNAVLGREATELDPSRVAAQVVSGIGFLGVGIIMFRRDVVIGLTTAAGIWAVATIGLAVGGGLYLAAIAATVIALAVVIIIRPLESRITRGPNRLSLTVVADHQISLTEFDAAIGGTQGLLERLQVEPAADPRQSMVKIVIGSVPNGRGLALVDTLKGIPGVQKVELEK